MELLSNTVVNQAPWALPGLVEHPQCPAYHCVSSAWHHQWGVPHCRDLCEVEELTSVTGNSPALSKHLHLRDKSFDLWYIAALQYLGNHLVQVLPFYWKITAERPNSLTAALSARNLAWKEGSQGKSNGKYYCVGKSDTRQKKSESSSAGAKEGKVWRKGETETSKVGKEHEKKLIVT